MDKKERGHELMQEKLAEMDSFLTATGKFNDKGEADMYLRAYGWPAILRDLLWGDHGRDKLLLHLSNGKEMTIKAVDVAGIDFICVVGKYSNSDDYHEATIRLDHIVTIEPVKSPT